MFDNPQYKLAVKHLVGLLPADVYGVTLTVAGDLSYLDEQAKPLLPTDIELERRVNLEVRLRSKGLLKLLDVPFDDGQSQPQLSPWKINLGHIEISRGIATCKYVDPKINKILKLYGIEVVLPGERPLYEDGYRKEHQPWHSLDLPSAKLEQFLALLPRDKFAIRLEFCNSDHSALLRRIMPLLPAEAKDPRIEVSARTSRAKGATRQQTLELYRVNEERKKQILETQGEMAKLPKQFSEIKAEHPELYARYNQPYVQIHELGWRNQDVSLHFLGTAFHDKEKVEIEYSGPEPEYLLPLVRTLAESDFEVQLLINPDREYF